MFILLVGWVLFILESVNGDRIDSTHVHDGDRLTLGRTSMTIHLGDRT